MRPARSDSQSGYITKNHGCKIPKRFIFVDCETFVRDNPKIPSQKIHTLRFGHVQVCDFANGSYKISQSESFFSEFHFWRIVEDVLSGRFVVWVVAHNATYDFSILGLWERIGDGTICLRREGKSYIDTRTGEQKVSEEWIGKLSIDNTPFIVECEYDGRRVNFIDSMNYFDSSLSELAGHVGTIKEAMPKDNEGFDKWQKYCRTDVDIIRKAVTRIAAKWHTNNLGNWQETISGLAFSSYRHCHMVCPIRYHSSDRVRTLESDANYGGECRAFYRGQVNHDVAVYDVSSLYPFVMATELFPCELAGTDENVSPKQCLKMAQNYGVIIDATIETERDYYPFRFNGRTVFPVGRFRTRIAGDEAQYGLLSGDVTEVHFAAYYHKRDLFSTFIKYWYAVKIHAENSGDTVMRKFAKLVMNSLYGKFAQKNKGYRYNPNVDVVQPWRVFPWINPETKQMHYARSIGWNAQVAVEPHYTTQAFPAISAFVASAGRCRMRDIRNAFSGFSIYYQDTDSIIVDDSKYTRDIAKLFETCDDLGTLRFVRGAKSAIFRGQRNYQLDHKIIASGVRSRDKLIGETEFIGERFERSARIVTRPPDSTVRSEFVTFNVPGRPSEGGYRPNGWYFPAKFA